eukprot:EG_transcript_22741
MAVDTLPRTSGHPDDAPCGPEDGEPLVMQGIMYKRGTLNPMMQARYFVLKGSNLRYYKEQGTIYIPGSDVKPDTTDPCLLKIEESGRVWLFKTKTPAERESWVKHLKRVSEFHPTSNSDNKLLAGKPETDDRSACNDEEVLYEYQTLSTARRWSPNNFDGHARWTLVKARGDCRTNHTVQELNPNDPTFDLGEWFVQKCDNPGEGWEYSPDPPGTTVAWASQPPRVPLTPPLFRRRAWVRQSPAEDPPLAEVVDPWVEDALQKLKAINEAMETFVASDQKR